MVKPYRQKIFMKMLYFKILIIITIQFVSGGQGLSR